MFFVSCFNTNKINKTSSSDFLAYYNTFYMAEKYFNDSMSIIQLDESGENEIPSQAITLLNSAIENALIIEDKFYNTKYLDDAYYILGMSSFYKNNFTSSQYYFERIINEYYTQEYYIKSLIMLGSLNLKMNKINDLKNILALIEDLDNLNQKENYLYYILKADYSKYNEDIVSVKKNYVLALENLNDSNDKISIYYKLLLISENEKDYLNAILCIDSIEKLRDEENISPKLLQKWIDYKNKIRDFSSVINKLNIYLDNEQLLKKQIYYNIEKSKTYIYMQDYSSSENILIDILNEHSDNSIMRVEISEANFIMGGIYLNYYNDFKKSQEFYQASIDKSKTSLSGKKSQKIINSISSYNNLMNEIVYLNTIADSNVDSENLESNPFSNPMPNILNHSDGLDSLIFNSAQILYFDLDIKDSALYKFKYIIDEFPKSNFHYKALIMMDMEEPDAKWSQMLLDEYLKSSDDISIDLELDSLRDLSWDILSNSSSESIDSFKNIYTKYKDEKSLYMVGLIYDDYLKDLDSSFYYYDMYLDNFESGIYSKQISNRAVELKDMIKFNYEFINQKIVYRKAIEYFENKNLIDSTIYFLEDASNGIDRNLKSYCKNIIESFKLYMKNDSLYKMNYSNIDSVKMNLANILYKDLSYDSLASIYYIDIVNNSISTKNINESLAALSKMDLSSNWDSLLYSNIQDSNLYMLLVNNSSRNYQYNIKGSKSSDFEDLQWFSNKYYKHVEIDLDYNE
jgi:hypothetical protein